METFKALTPKLTLKNWFRFNTKFNTVNSNCKIVKQSFNEIYCISKKK